MYIVIISKLHLHSSVNSILMPKTVNNILIEPRVPSLAFTLNSPAISQPKDFWIVSWQILRCKAPKHGLGVRSDIPGCLADLSWRVADINGKLGNQVWNIGLSN